MKRKFPRNTDLALDPRATSAVLALYDEESEPPEDDRDPYEIEGGRVAVVCIEGPLAPRASAFWDGYDAILADFSAAMGDPLVGSVLLDISSPGGCVSGLLELVAQMRAVKAKGNKPVIAFANGSATSAAYAIASVADRILVSATSVVGSIGVIAMLADETKANELAGLRVEVVSSGEQKTDGHPDVPVSAAAVGRLKRRVDKMALQLAAAIAPGRPGSSTASLLALQGAVFVGDEALSVGLADEVVSSIESAISISQQLGVQNMQAISEALGLSGTPDEREIVASIKVTRAHQDERAQLLGALGVQSVAEALGMVQGLRQQAAVGEAATARVKELEAQIQAHEREDLFAANAGKFTPALRDWAATLPIDGLRAFVAAAPEIPQLRLAPKEPGSAGGPVLQWQGKSWAEMSPDEKGLLAHSNPDLFAAMRAASLK